MLMQLRCVMPTCRKALSSSLFGQRSAGNYCSLERPPFAFSYFSVTCVKAAKGKRCAEQQFTYLKGPFYNTLNFTFFRYNFGMEVLIEAFVKVLREIGSFF